MTKIPAWVFIAVGLFVSITSLFRYGKFIAFFYAGLVFIVVGLIKIISKLIGGKTEEADAHHAHSIPKHTLQVKYCRQCGSQMRVHDRFCIRCGARV